MTLHKYLTAFLLYFTFSISCIAAGSDHNEIQLLVKQGQFNEALKLTNEQLARNQSDIKLQFLKGLVLTRLERFQEAEEIFIKLTKNNPELPEPYNNLAVVYAAQGKFGEAEKALQSAINTHPSYATAHENLGDIYAKMASRAYNQALELDTGNQTAREKLSLVNELISAPESETSKVVVAKKENKPKPAPKPAPKPVAKVEEKPKPEIITVKVDETKDKEVAETVVEDTAKNRQQVEQAILAWAQAWSDQNVDAYIASYGRDFIPARGISRARWERERAIRLKRPSFIKVNVSNLKINLHGKDYAEIKFTQSYRSDTYRDQVRKEVLMRKVDNKWFITRERSL